MPPSFDAVIFDMDGLMLDTETLSRVAWQKAGHDVGCEIDDALFIRFVGRTREDCETILKEIGGPAFPVEVMRERILHHWDEQVILHGIPQKTGLTELMEFLDSIKLRKAVATSSRRENALSKLGPLAKAFEVLVTGDEISRGKPAPDIFLLAARRLDLAPNRCLVLEDSLPGIQAATAAGMHAIMVPDLVPATAEIRHSCATLLEVLLWLKDGAKQPVSSR